MQQEKFRNVTVAVSLAATAAIAGFLICSGSSSSTPTAKSLADFKAWEAEQAQQAQQMRQDGRGAPQTDRVTP